MSDIMTPMKFDQLLKWIIYEKKKYGTVFGEKRPYKADAKYSRTIFGRKLETPIGPAAGPHTQLTQNIVASYYTGSRFFELKTVQIMDGAELSACVNKPCIKADDECYNCEWSTELYVPQAMEQYIKAWFLCKVMAKEFGLGDVNGFQFNISVGYDLEGIKSAKIEKFLNTMQNASEDETFCECRKYLLDNLNLFEHVTREDILAIQPEICNSATISTLHGCPPSEIERIAMYLITEKGFHTFIKCNPTLLGYEYARKIMDDMGYDYVAFGDFHFKDDLQYEDAVPMFKRLMKVCAEKNLEFGVKITNTFPVDVKNNELPSEEMYMSGKSLYPLSISLASKLADEFDGALRVSYSGGADYYNISGIVNAGIWPVTFATTLLKPGGYQRFEQIAKEVEEENAVFTKIDAEKAKKLVEDVKNDPHHVKAVKPLPSRKSNAHVPLLDCFTAPCKGGCPIHQDIPAYLKLVSEEKYSEALDVILRKNPLPFITGTICAHNCMSKCSRNFYEEPVHIRAMKLLAAENGFNEIKSKLGVPEKSTTKKIAVVGGGPAGMAASYFLKKNGFDTTIFEKTGSLGGVVRHVIPEFRISDDAIDNDASILEKIGVNIQYNMEIQGLDSLWEKGYSSVIIAVGASKSGVLRLEKGESINALDFLREFKKTKGNAKLGKNVVVIGGGNTAMDTARAALRNEGVEHVYLVYRRTKRYMPADEEELTMAIEDGVEFMELLSPVSHENKKLLCRVMELSDFDSSGRRGIVETEEMREVPADIVIASVGEKVPSEFYHTLGIDTDDRGRAILNENTLESSVKNVYLIGDGKKGPATVVEGIADALKAVSAVIGKDIVGDTEKTVPEDVIYGRRAVLKSRQSDTAEGERCLSCSQICENCAEVCPNRANIALRVRGMTNHQIIHVDYMCNECGNCTSFCPYESSPYRDKFTLFANTEDMADSVNQGFVVLNKATCECRIRYSGSEFDWKPEEAGKLPDGLAKIIETVCKEYPWLIVS